MFKPSYFEINDIPILITSLESLCSLLVEKSLKGAGCEVHLCNTYTMALADRNIGLREILEFSQFNVPDGWPISSFGKKFGSKIQIRGSDLFDSLCRETMNHDITHYLIGGTENSLGKLQENILMNFPKLKLVGASPYWMDSEAPDVSKLVDKLQMVKPSIVWIGIGTPKQDFLVKILGNHFPGTIFIPIGGVFNFLSGETLEAGYLIRLFKLEWFFRLVQEPKRLWRRYLLISVPYLLKIWSQRISRVSFERIKNLK